MARRLKRFAPLSDADERLLLRLVGWRHEPAGAALVRDRLPNPARVLVSGWAARVRWTAEGKRQIVGFVLPGDMLALCRRPQPLGTCLVIALTPVQTLDAEPLVAALQSMPPDAALSHAVNIATAMDEAWLIDQVVRLGRRSAYERVAHLLMELYFRLKTIDQVRSGIMALPLTQEMLADATGLSIVHVNRTLQQLRRERLLELHHGRLTILDEHALVALSGFLEPQPGSWSYRHF